MPQWVYRFGTNASSGDASMSALLGGKGANLAEMANIGLPVPPGFTLTTEVCQFYTENQNTYPESLKSEVHAALEDIEHHTGAQFGGAPMPLLVSVRSGARVSMPGMMDTVLNLGLNDQTVEHLAQQSANPRFAWDSYRRFIQMYAHVVLGVEHYLFEEALDLLKDERGLHRDTDLGVEEWQHLVGVYKTIVLEALGTPFPQDVHEQLWGAIGAVLKSWDSDRAKVYRKLNDIPAAWGTAVTIQAMVFGNMGDTSATGVAFTRDPSTGAAHLYGEYLINAQGEDVVAGIRTPQYLTTAARLAADAKGASLEEAMPDTYAQLRSVFTLLEKHYRDMQDIEFTVQQGKLWLLQTRSGKRTAKAALKIAVDLANEGLITTEDAILSVNPASLDQLLHPTLDPKAQKVLLTKGLPASPGAASGMIVFTAEDAEKRAHVGEDTILVRTETSPEDIHGMHAARGILTTRGGMTSHAAVVARGMGKPCVSGAGTVIIDSKKGVLRIGTHTFNGGDWITIDGSSGEVMAGRVPMVQPELVGDFATLIEWADKKRRLKIRANAETPHDCKTARQFGAEGIGLCRTEHMFFESDRILAVRQMILSNTPTERRAALNILLPMQKADFIEIFNVMAPLPCTVRLLDPPLHEFLPHSEAEYADVAQATGVSVDIIRSRVQELHEFNPMLGHRGCRLGITYPEIYEMQTRALLEAAIEVETKTGTTICPEIMIPLIATVQELTCVKAIIDQTAADVFSRAGRTIAYKIGTMIELPRAALCAADIAHHADFFSFGTNDLTQTTLGISRDDAARFLAPYVTQGIYEKDPFVTLDIPGVGALVEMATRNGTASNPQLKLGICGEHGGDPESIAFCERIGLDYVSCSPYRVPIARLAAAQAALRHTRSPQ